MTGSTGTSQSRVPGSKCSRDGTDGFGANDGYRIAHPRTEGSCVRQGPSDRHWPPTGWCHQRAQSSAQRVAGVLQIEPQPTLMPL